MQRMTAPVFHLIPHTHWDREWYLPRAGFLVRLAPMMRAALSTLERNPEQRFLLDGQTVLIRDYLDVCPGDRSRLAALGKAGGLQTGPWYVLADALIPSAEAAIRNLQVGLQDSAEVGGTLRVLYSPDAFGHPASLPVLAAEFGVEGIALWRGHAGDRDLFAWRAPDGTEALVYHFPPAGYEFGVTLPAGMPALKPVWQQLREELLARAVTRHVAVFIGADHHPLRTDLSALQATIAGLEPGAEVRVSRLDDFLAAARAEASGLAVITGELRNGAGHTWALQGVHGTRLPLKRLNAGTELLLERHAEPLAAMAQRAGGDDNRLLLERAWRSVLESQFHDTIAGTVHDDAAAEANGRLRDGGALARFIRDSAFGCLAGVTGDEFAIGAESGTLVAWNPRATGAGGVAIVEVTRFLRDELVGLPDGRTARVAGALAADFTLAGPEGAWPVQILGRREAVERIEHPGRYPDADRVDVTRVAVLVPPLPGMSFSQAHLAPSGVANRSHGRVTAGSRTIRNEHLEVRPHADGSLTVSADSGVVLHRVLRLWAEQDSGDCYTVSARGRAPLALRRPCTWRVLARGPLVAAVEGDLQGSDVAVRIQLELRSSEDFVRIRLDLDNRARERRLLALVPGGDASTALAGAPFGFERRARPLPGAWSGEARVTTAPAQRFVAAAGVKGGAAVLTAGHAEYELTAGGDLMLTVLRSVGQLSRADLPERPGHAAWPTPVPAAQCLGRSSWSLALWPCTAPAADDPAHLVQVWERAFLDPVVRWYRGRDAAPPAATCIELTGEGLVPSAVVPARQGDGMILRCYNVLEREVAGAWRVRPKAVRAWQVRADETRLGSLPVNGELIPFRAGPRALISVRVA